MKKRIFYIVPLLLLMFLLSACSVFAADATAANIVYPLWLLEIWMIFKPWFITVLVLILADLIMGLLAAIVKGAYDWRKVADFIGTNIFPKFGGYIVAVLIAYFTGSLETLGEFTELLGGGLEIIVRTAVIVSLVADVIAHFQTIFGIEFKIPGLEAEYQSEEESGSGEIAAG